MVKKYHGIYFGKVTDNKDDDKLGRVKVKIDMLCEDAQTDWIPVMALYGSKECGAFFIPEKDDEVVVTFMDGNPSLGVVIGSVWNNDQKPPETKENSGSDLNKDGKNNMRFIKSRSEHMIIMDDKDGEEKLQIIAAGGKTRIEYLKKDKKMNIKTDVDLKISAEKKLTIKAEEMEIKVDKTLKIKGDSVSMEAKSSDVEIKASTNLTLEGSTVKLN
jgi:uncharacterized protein involved in type VI secretion and phage assembly